MNGEQLKIRKSLCTNNKKIIEANNPLLLFFTVKILIVHKLFLIFTITNYVHSW